MDYGVDFYRLQGTELERRPAAVRALRRVDSRDRDGSGRRRHVHMTNSPSRDIG